MPARGSRILYIDDDAGLRRLVERSLVRHGFVVETAASGPDGVEKARAEHFDLVAVDHYMPGQDGLVTLGQLRALPDPPPVIYVTGSEESRIAVAALKAGAVDYVVKTVGEDFLDLLCRAIEQAVITVRTEERLRETNARLQAMLHEVNHRVANSLQLVSAFVHLQARSADAGAKAALEDTQRRIAAIAQVHKRLYTGESVDAVAMDDYLASLVSELEETWSTPEAPRTIRLSADPVRLDPDKAVALGIIVSELVSNACKYAYGARQAGEVRVALAREGEGRFLLQVEDDGVGLPADGKVLGTGLGSKLIKAMASTLKSAVKYDSAHRGVSATIRAAC
jgi:two-component sensor histidine kinase